MGSLTDVTYAGGDNRYILYILVILFFSTAAAGILVTRLLTGHITRPIKILTGHIRKISETNDFSPDPDIEASSDEIGEIGKAVNQMTDHIQNLLGQQARMYEQKKNIEISLLQSQINPHFLYNTLDSIRWMAVIQGSKNIEQTTGALERLLRNMAKGIGDKITLREELELVGNYIYIQQVRYVEIFDYICQIPEELLDCRIIKFTLQPIVENAILHGIEPMKQFGEIE
ncbi:MAG: histidine kinase, partial [Lachnospiraceae bacterium]|nr:histidine kinase [Lachnospiraceae bacterium]